MLSHWSPIQTTTPSSVWSNPSFTVPDLKAALAHLREHNVKILKEPGESGADITARGIGLSTDTSINKPVWEVVEPLVSAEDPDGYLLELIQQ